MPRAGMLGVQWPCLPEQNCLVPLPQGIPSETSQFIVRKQRPKILIQSPHPFSISALPPPCLLSLETVNLQEAPASLLAIAPEKSCGGSCRQAAHVSGFCGLDKVSDRNNLKEKPWLMGSGSSVLLHLPPRASSLRVGRWCN